MSDKNKASQIIEGIINSPSPKDALDAFVADGGDMNNIVVKESEDIYLRIYEYGQMEVDACYLTAAEIEARVADLQAYLEDGEYQEDDRKYAEFKALRELNGQEPAGKTGAHTTTLLFQAIQDKHNAAPEDKAKYEKFIDQLLIDKRCDVNKADQKPEPESHHDIHQSLFTRETPISLALSLEDKDIFDKLVVMPEVDCNKAYSGENTATFIAEDEYYFDGDVQEKIQTKHNSLLQQAREKYDRDDRNTHFLNKLVEERGTDLDKTTLAEYFKSYAMDVDRRNGDMTLQRGEVEEKKTSLMEAQVRLNQFKSETSQKPGIFMRLSDRLKGYDREAEQARKEAEMNTSVEKHKEVIASYTKGLENSKSRQCEDLELCAKLAPYVDEDVKKEAGYNPEPEEDQSLAS